MQKERLLLWTLAAINFTHIVDFMILMPLGPQLMRIFTISPQEFGLLVSSYTFSAGISSFFGAFILDKYDRRSILIWVFLAFLSPACPIGTLHFSFWRFLPWLSLYLFISLFPLLLFPQVGEIASQVRWK